MRNGLVRRLVPVTAVVVTVLTVAGCGSSEPTAASSTVGAPSTVESSTAEASTVEASTAPPPGTGSAAAASSSTAAASPAAPPAVAEPDENGTYAWRGPGVIGLVAPPDGPSVLALACPSCTGPVTVLTDGYPPSAIAASGPYDGEVLLGATGGPPVTELTVTADADWTASIVPLAEHPPSPPTTDGQGDAVLVLTDPATAATLGYEAAEEFSMVIYQADGTSQTIHDIGPFHDTVAVQTPAVIAIVADGAWSVAAS